MRSILVKHIEFWGSFVRVLSVCSCYSTCSWLRRPFKLGENRPATLKAWREWASKPRPCYLFWCAAWVAAWHLDWLFLTRRRSALGPSCLLELQDCARAQEIERHTRSNQTDCQIPSVPVYQMFMGAGLRRCLPRGMCALSVGSYTRTISSWTPFLPFLSASVMSTLNLSYLQHSCSFFGNGPFPDLCLSFHCLPEHMQLL